MATINEAIRICKRIMLTNLLTNDYSLALTPLLSGKHGIGKSQVAKNIAKDIHGTVMTIEGHLKGRRNNGNSLSVQKRLWRY